MTENKKGFRNHLRSFSVKALKAAIKALIFYGIYFLLSTFLAPVSDMAPSLRQTIEMFMTTYIILLIIGELTAGTIFQYFFKAARALFVILYLMLSLNGGMVGITHENVHLMVDLRLFMAIVMLLSLLGFAKSIIQGVDFLNCRTENPQV